jgi:hypothetical protein
MRQFVSNPGEVVESKFNDSIKFVTGDKVKLMVTAIKPSKSEQEEVDAITEIGGDWTEHANFRDGMLFICNAIAVEKNGKWMDIVDYSDYENIKLPFGKFGYQFYHTVNFGNMFGKDGGWPFKVSAKQSKGSSVVNVTYSIPSAPIDWEEWSPADRYDYWCSMGSLMLNCGKEKPSIVESDLGWVIDQNSIHRLAVGDICTAYILKQASKTDSDKFYTYLKTMVKNPDQSKKSKYIVKNDFDLTTVENSYVVANAIYDAINKAADTSEKSHLDKLVESDEEVF